MRDRLGTRGCFGACAGRLMVDKTKKNVAGWLRDRGIGKRQAGSVLIMLISALAYLNTVPNGFVWDDRYLIEQNPYLRSLDHVPSYFVSSRTQGSYDMKVYRPLRQAMFNVEYQLFGAKPAGYHVMNVILHSLNALALFLLLRRLLPDSRLSFLLVVLYAVHPVHTEVVANITGRADILFSIFYLAGLTLFIRSRDDQRKTIFLFGSAMAYALSLLSKEMAVTFPIMVLTIDIYLNGGDWRAIQRTKWFHVSLIIISVMYGVMRTVAIGELGAGDYAGDSIWTTLASQTVIVGKYIKLFFLPYPLTARYDIVPVENLFNLFTICAVLLASALVAFTAFSLKHRRFSLFLLGCWWFVITLLPVSNIIPIRAAMMAERYLYLPLAGLFIVVFSLVQTFLKRELPASREVLGIVYSVCFAAFFCVTLSRNTVWKDNLTLFEDTRTKAPNSLVVHWNLFEEYRKAGNGAKAAVEYQEMIRINEEVARGYLVIAERYQGRGNRTAALRMTNKALSTKPDLHEAIEYRDKLLSLQ